MSLKAFHIVFVLTSVAMSALVGVWGVRDYLLTSNTTNLAVGITTLVLGVLLVWYSTWFVRKIRMIKSL